MRTTVTIDDHLLAAARALAARTRRTLGEVVDDALRVLLTERPIRTPPERVSLSTFGGSGLRPGVDLENKEALAELMDESVADVAR